MVLSKPLKFGSIVLTHFLSLFVILARESCLIFLLVYVDNIIVTGNDSNILRCLISQINPEFAIKDLGRLINFLRVEVTYTSDGLFRTQAKYAHNIRTCAQLIEAKPVATPFVVGNTLSSDGAEFYDPTLYRSLVSSNIFLSHILT